MFDSVLPENPQQVLDLTELLNENIAWIVIDFFVILWYNNDVWA